MPVDLASRFRFRRSIRSCVGGHAIRIPRDAERIAQELTGELDSANAQTLAPAIGAPCSSRTVPDSPHGHRAYPTLDYSDPVPVATAETSEAGTFTLWLAPGENHVRATADGYAVDRKTID